MLILLSPAKIQNLTNFQLPCEHSLPQFLKLSEKIVNEVRQLSAFELSQLLDVNAKIAQLNVERYSQWHLPFTTANSKQTVVLFDGEVFKGLDAKTLSEDDVNYMQNHLRILSGLYGVLRPLDLIQPYRLEISSRLPVGETNDLYGFWGDKLTEAINEALPESGGVLLNLASGEYFKSINQKLLKAEVIDVDFLEYKNDRYKAVVMYIKKARGLMARYVIENQIVNIDDLKGFSADGYWYSEKLSDKLKLVFVREKNS